MREEHRPVIRIFADESSRGLKNEDPADRPGGAGGLVEFWNWQTRQWVRRDYWLSHPSTTNNRMALSGAAVGLSLIRQPCQIVFVSDSQYLINGIQKSLQRSTVYQTNRDLWEVLVKAARVHTIRWVWVRGHNGHPQNEYADFLASRASHTMSNSDGLVPSSFEKWIKEQRFRRRRFRDFDLTKEDDMCDIIGVV